MTGKKFLLLQSNPISVYTLNDIEQLENVVIYHRKKVSDNRLVNLLHNIHNSGKIQRYVNLPFKRIWDKILFNKLLKSYIPDYIVFTASWYSEHLVSYFRKKCKGAKLILRFTDKVTNAFGDNDAIIKKIGEQFDGILVYSQEDADKYGFTYHSVGYSAISKRSIKPAKKYDVVFIGAEKGRIEQIRQAYHSFVSAGLSCFFYVTMVREENRKEDGIIYAEKTMPFCDYISHEFSAKCLFELVQEGSSGRTFRMMEAIMYNKLLITNCTEIKKVGYYNPQYVQMYDDVSEIDASFVVNSPIVVDYNYKGDFSPVKVLNFIERTW